MGIECGGEQRETGSMPQKKKTKTDNCKGGAQTQIVIIYMATTGLENISLILTHFFFFKFILPIQKEVFCFIKRKTNKSCQYY